MNNPLLENQKLPLFSKILPEHIESALQQILLENRQEINHLLKQSTHTWSSLMMPLQALNNRLSNMWSPVSHMNSVVNSDELSQAYRACLPLLSDYSTQLGQDENLFNAVKQVANNQDLNSEQKKLLADELLDFHLTGIDLPEEKQEEFAGLSKALSQLTNQFEQNILDCSNAWQHHVDNETLLNGLPENIKAAAKQQAQSKKLEGWLLTLDIPIYIAVMTHAENNDLRQLFYTAYNTRASDQGPHDKKFDNTKIMQEILEKRAQLAKLLDYNNYAERSLAKKMASKPQEVLTFLEDLATKAHTFASKEYQQLLEFAQEHFQLTQLNAWDVAYYCEKLRQHKYDISEESLRPYFPEDKVLQGMFTIVEKLYGMTIKQCENSNTWHEDVKFFDIHDESGQLRGQFYIDLYARSRKRGGAWMDECRVRLKDGDGQVQIPVAYLTCNFSAPINNKPSLLSHDEVITLFHEFGHTLHHVLTQVDYAEISGINGVPWDVVEFPSQFMENFCWQRETLDLISGHVDSGDAIPNELYQKMLAAKNFQAAMKLVRQLEFALFDFRLHMEFDNQSTNQVQAILNQVREQVAVVKAPEFNRFQHGFSHIFAGGYAAGYYSYLWAEVMAADAFELFIDNGVLDSETGRKFLYNILERGGAEAPDVLFKRLCHRTPQIEALLRSYGLE